MNATVLLSMEPYVCSNLRVEQLSYGLKQLPILFWGFLLKVNSIMGPKTLF